MIILWFLLVTVQVYAQENVDSDLNGPVKRQVDQLSGTERQKKLSTSLASTKECQYDIQQYCVKKGNKIPPNIEVLKCFDELDNVSISILK